MTMRLHEIEQEPGHTPEIWRYMLSAIMLRYGARWFPKFIGEEHINPSAAATITDVATGALSTSVVVNHVRKTVKQINNIYRELVALDLDKTPEEVTWRDFMRSENTLVRDAIGNLFKQNLQRGLAALVPFVGPVGKLALELFDTSDHKADRMHRLDDTFELGLGVMGVVQYLEVNRKRTVFEHIRSFVSTELNPGHALESHIDLNHLHHMYQAYAKKFQPHSYFRHEDRDHGKEANALMIFDRMSELMNASYQSQALYPGNTQFRLPNFLYLMGHNLIDTTKPEQTMLYAEVMAKQGVKAVRQVEKELAGGAQVGALAEKYGVTVDAAKLRESFMKRHPAHTKAFGEPLHGHEAANDHAVTPSTETARRFTDTVKSKTETAKPVKKMDDTGHAGLVTTSRELTPEVSGLKM